jgi:hypothetical protein
MPASKPIPLRREIPAILVVKLALIVAIKLIFFSDPVKPGSEGAAAALLSPAHSTSASQSAPARSSTHE